MDLELSNNFKGKCLIAMPSIKDDIFNHSVIYITEHSSISGAVGVIINKHLSDKRKQMTNFDFNRYHNQWGKIPLYFGGPVELSTGFILHQAQEAPEWELTGSRQKIEQMASEDKVKPLMMTAGYCMWDSFQLEREVRYNNWLVIDGAAEHLLADFDPADRYSEALRVAGISNLATFDFNCHGNA